MRRIGSAGKTAVYALREISEWGVDMKIALASARIVDGDIPHNLMQMKRHMRAAKGEGADLICFGEAFLQGFDALSWQYRDDKKIALTTSSREFMQIKALTREIGIDVLFGYNELAQESIYSSCALISGGRIIHNYRRISKGWKEYTKTDGHYREGKSVEVFDYRGKKCVIGLCGDLWEYPERFALGEDILFWPVYVCWTEAEWENGGKMEYAQQANVSCVNTLYINSLCDGDAFGGALHFHNGDIAGELALQTEGLLLVEV